MEENVWSKDKIRSTLTEDFVLISLYVDDRSELPEAEHKVVERLDRPGEQMVISKVGKKWHYLEQSVYQKTTQPYYVLISPNGKTLNPPVSYTPNAGDYAQFLECGLSTYRALSDAKIEVEPEVNSLK
jgi:thiol:disulfide interchange protein DsbD